jgi:hypothetical protein
MNQKRAVVGGRKAVLYVCVGSNNNSFPND